MNALALAQPVFLSNSCVAGRPGVFIIIKLSTESILTFDATVTNVPYPGSCSLITRRVVDIS